MRVGPKLGGPIRLAAQAARGKRRKRARRGLLWLAVAACLAVAASAAILQRTGLTLSFLNLAKTSEPAPAQKTAGHIIVPQINSDLCDRYQFDNNSGAMKQVETFACGAREKVVTTDKVNNFSSSWRGSR